MPDADILKHITGRTVERDKIWDNPEPKVPFETAHLKNNRSEEDEDLDEKKNEALIALEHLNTK